MKYYFLLIIACLSLKAFAQEDYTWWENKHNWDGHSDWKNYLTYSAEYFGPNALVVPEVKDATINNKLKLKIRPEYHFAKGDNTVNLYTSLSYPLKDIASFEVYIVPIEYYNIYDSVFRDERAIRSYNPKGIAGGDFYFGTNIRVIKDHKRIPDITFSAFYKTASGTNLYDARYTDAPAYYIHLSFGKNIIEKENTQFRIYGNAGTYIWQTLKPWPLQNDAFLYGIGMKYIKNRTQTMLNWGGYSGYINNGDRPMVLRFETGIHNKKENWFYSVYLQKGIMDFPYTTVSLSASYKLGIKQ